MRAIVAVVLLATAAAAPKAAPTVSKAAPAVSKEGYQRTKWGMSPADVRALYPTSMDAAEARKLKPGAFEGEGEFLLAETTILKRKAWATLTFGKNGLAEVSVRPEIERADACPNLKDALTEKYGTPKESSEDDTADLYLGSFAWETAETRIEFDCSSVKTEKGRATMKKKAPGAELPADLPADAVRLHYARLRTGKK
jgi:hypothetical protein